MRSLVAHRRSRGHASRRGPGGRFGLCALLGIVLILVLAPGGSSFSVDPSGGLLFGPVVVGTTATRDLVVTLEEGEEFALAFLTGGEDGFDLTSNTCAGAVGPTTCTITVSFTPQVVGYTADILYLALTSGSELFHGVDGNGTLIATTTALSSSLNPSLTDDAVTLTATVTAASGPDTPIGTVDFYANGNLLGSITPTDGVASVETAFDTAGVYVIAADYSGSTTHDPDSDFLEQTVEARDTDGDGIPDDEDVEGIQEAVAALPATAFKGGDPGHANAIRNALEDVEAAVAAGNTALALDRLRSLRKRVDGCGSKADKTDWIVDCTAQLEIRELIDDLIANLSS